MTTILQPKIERFFGYWSERLEFIKCVNVVAPHDRHHETNVLLLASLDSLANLWAQAVQRKKDSDRRRLGEFLLAFGDRPDVFEKLSLPYLWHRVDQKSPNFQGNATTILQNCGSRKPAPSGPDVDRACRDLADDPTANDLLTGELASIVQGPDGSAIRDWVNDSRFGEILYTEYRCSWVHEGRGGRSSHSFNLGDDAPTYLDPKYVTPPRIGFPIPFLCEVLADCIKNFKEKVEQDGIDPVPPPYMATTDLEVDGE